MPTHLRKHLETQYPVNAKPILIAGAGFLSDTHCPTYENIQHILDNDEKLNKDFEQSIKHNSNMLLVFWRTLFSFYNYGNNQIQVLSLMEQGYFDTIITSNYDVFFEKCIAEQFDYWKTDNDDTYDSIIKSYLDGTKKIVKFHGDIEQANVDSVHLMINKGVFPKTAQVEYDKFKQIISPKAPIFVIGYAGKDNDALFIELQALHNPVKWFLYDKNIDDNAVKLEIKRLEEALGQDRIDILRTSGIEDELSAFDFPHALKKPKAFTISQYEAVKKSFYLALSTIRLLEEIQKQDTFIGVIKSKEQQLKEIFYTQAEPIPCGQSGLYVLRDVNSYTPILPKPNKHVSNISNVGTEEDVRCVGGGYFLVHDQKGIVIDPGYDFINNFFNACNDDGQNQEFTTHKRSLSNINAIVITHAHNDHFGDFDSLNNLLFQYNKAVDQNHKIAESIRHISALHSGNPPQESVIIRELGRLLIENRDYYDGKLLERIKTYRDNLVNTHEIDTTALNNLMSNQVVQQKIRPDLYMSRSAYQALNGLMPIQKKHSDNFRRVIILNPGDSIKHQVSPKITLEAIEVKHQDIYSTKTPCGLKFGLQDETGNKKNIGFTADSGYYIGFEKHFTDCEYLIAHLGSVKPQEVGLISAADGLSNELNDGFRLPSLAYQPKNSVFYEYHLGLLGMNVLISHLVNSNEKKLKKILISEIGEELKQVLCTLIKAFTSVYHDQNIEITLAKLGHYEDFA